MYEFMHRLINARYSLPAWEWAVVTTLMASVIGLYAYLQPDMVVDVTSALPFDGKLWAPALVASSVLAMYGMAKNKYWAVRHGAFASFLLVLFLDFSWWMSSDAGWLNVVVFGSWLTVFWLYKYLASFARERDGV